MPRNTFFVFRFLLLFLLIRPRAFRRFANPGTHRSFSGARQCRLSGAVSGEQRGAMVGSHRRNTSDDADYFKPLMSWLEQQNKGHQIGWE